MGEENPISHKSVWGWYRGACGQKSLTFEKGTNHDSKATIYVKVMVFYATFSNILAMSWRSGLLEGKTGMPGENHRPVTSH